VEAAGEEAAGVEATTPVGEEAAEVDTTTPVVETTVERVAEDEDSTTTREDDVTTGEDDATVVGATVVGATVVDSAKLVVDVTLLDGATDEELDPPPPASCWQISLVTWIVVAASAAVQAAATQGVAEV
jgi:hypothetical protein